MGISVSLFLAAIGAVLVFAVNSEVEGVSLDAVGVILMVVAGVGLLWSLFLMGPREYIKDDHNHADHTRRGPDDEPYL